MNFVLGDPIAPTLHAQLQKHEGLICGRPFPPRARFSSLSRDEQDAPLEHDVETEATGSHSTRCREWLSQGPDY